MCTRFSLYLLLGALFTSSVQAGEIDDAHSAFQAGDYEQSLSILRPLAESGNAEAQHFLAHFYYKGYGVERDVNLSLQLQEKAAEAGWANAQADLGLIYLYRFDFGVETDYDKALRLFTAAAAQGNAKAQTNLGIMYEQGLGVSQDVSEGIRWILMGAEGGDPIAQHNLAASYATGHGVPFDFVKAMAWYRKSAEQGFADSQYKIGLMYEHGEGVGPDVEEARKWYAMAADQGHLEAQAKLDAAETGTSAPPTFTYQDIGPDASFEDALAAAELDNNPAKFMLAVLYLNGEAIEQDYFKAAFWFKKTYENPWSMMRSEGQAAMGILYHNGLGVPRDFIKACYLFEEAANIGNPFDVYNFEKTPIAYLNVRPDLSESLAWFREAAEEDDAGAQFCLAIAYFRGLTVEKDQEQMIYWLEKAATLDNPWAQYYLASMYSDGNGVKKSATEAARWYEEAARQEFKDAQTMLAVSYYYGDGVSQSEEKAKYWLRKAIENGDTEAMEFWGWLDFGELNEEQFVGTFKENTYVAPNKLFRAEYRLASVNPRDPCCEETVQDSFNPETGFGTVVLSNEYGALNGVIYGPASLATGDSDDPIVGQWFDEVIMDLIRSNAPSATVLHQEPRDFHGMDAWVATVGIAEGGVIARQDLQTGSEERRDSVRGFVVFLRGENVFALMCEVNILSFFGENRIYDPDHWDAFLGELGAFYSTMKFND